MYVPYDSAILPCTRNQAWMQCAKWWTNEPSLAARICIIPGMFCYFQWNVETRHVETKNDFVQNKTNILPTNSQSNIIITLWFTACQSDGIITKCRNLTLLDTKTEVFPSADAAHINMNVLEVLLPRGIFLS